MVIAIDGPAGSGKSTVARAVAERLKYVYLDTGAMYRCVALALTEQPERSPADIADTVDIHLGDGVHLDGRDVTKDIRAPEVSEQASRISTDPAVRDAMTEKQRKLLSKGSWVVDGRDIGTVVAPDAAVKVYLTATAEERARRRAKELGADVESILKDQIRRDERDIQREHSPLIPARDAVPIDTTGLTIEQVVQQVATLAVEAKELS